MAGDRPTFRPDIEGLRGVAILLVVHFHAGARAFAGGFVGVDVFFVLSGFFITGLLVRERETTGDVSLNEFYGRRALRLLPALLVVLLATLAIVFTLYAPIDRPLVARRRGTVLPRLAAAARRRRAHPPARRRRSGRDAPHGDESRRGRRAGIT